VTGAADKTLRWWDTATGKETRREGPGWVYYNRAAFRPDGKMLMTVSHENHVRLWDVETGKQLPLTDGPGWTVAATTFSPDGRRVLSVSENLVYAHDAATGRELWRGAEHTDTAVQVVVTPDGQTAISSGNDGRIIFREVATGKVVRTIENRRHAVDVIAVSPDGRTLAALGGDAPDDAILRRWDVATGKAYPDAPLPPKGPKYIASSIRYTPDGTGIVIASGTESQVPVFDPDRKEFRQAFGPADGGVNCADITADGRMAAAATAGGSIILWEAATGRQRLMLKDVGYTTFLAFSPDGRFLAVGNDGSHRLLTGDKVIEHTDGRFAVRLLDSLTGREVHRFTGHSGSVYRLAWSADGHRLLSGSRDASALVWDISPAVRAKLPTGTLAADDAAKAVAGLTGSDGAAVYAQMAKLAGCPAAAVTALRGTLRPVSAPDPEAVAGLVRDLDSPQFAARERAAGQLHRLGEGVEGLLRKALDGKLSAEARDRIEKVLAEVRPPDQRLRQGRALEVLERIGDAESRKLLGELAAGAEGAWLTREAKASLARLTPPSR
jgi:WD40 repeat protein